MHEGSISLFFFNTCFTVVKHSFISYLRLAAYICMKIAKIGILVIEKNEGLFLGIF